MDYGLISHIILWTIGAMSVCSAIFLVGGLMSMGRSNYRKD